MSKKNINLELSHILWDYQFLKGYQASSEDEAIIITTIKNKLRTS